MYRTSRHISRVVVVRPSQAIRTTDSCLCLLTECRETEWQLRQRKNAPPKKRKGCQQPHHHHHPPPYLPNVCPSHGRGFRARIDLISRLQTHGTQSPNKDRSQWSLSPADSRHSVNKQRQKSVVLIVFRLTALSQQTKTEVSGPDRLQNHGTQSTNKDRSQWSLSSSDSQHSVIQWLLSSSDSLQSVNKQRQKSAFFRRLRSEGQNV